MAYYIFLKSLRSLEEFRKNPHVKIPPKSPCAKFQSIGIFKNQFLFGKEFSPSLSAHPVFRPNLLFLLPADFPPLPHWATAFRPAQPVSRLLPPPALTPGAHGAAANRPRAASPIAPTLPPEEKNGRIYFTFISPINRHHSPTLQSQKLAPSTPPLKLLQAGH
jgi:hypothetical protein